MSFRTRLTLFFLLIVVLPVAAVGFLVVTVAGDSASGKTDAALGEDLDVAVGIYEDDVAAAKAAGTALARDSGFQAALRSGDQATFEALTADLARAEGIRAYTFSGSGAIDEFSAGAEPRFAASTIRLEGGASSGALETSTTTPQAYRDAVAKATGEEAVVVTGGSRGGVVSTLEVDRLEIPDPGDSAELEHDGETLRVAATALPGGGGARVALLAEASSGGFLGSAPGVAAALAGFILVAFLAAVAISRTLQGQVQAMLAAAKRIGGGDFSGEVPVVGNDEMADLATEFNEMRDRLAAQMEQLRRQQREIESSVNRIGQAFASGLDRQALLDVLIETTVGACAADYGIVALGGQVGDEAETGEASDAARDAALEAEREAMRAGKGYSGEHEGVHALSSPLGRGAADEPLGAITVARSGKQFTDAERNVFFYLVGQATASVENVALHEMVTEQAVTDELTGLPNNRAFRKAIGREAARAARFKHELSLLLIDIDNFKQVNDTYGHLQGDAVLRVVGRVIGAESRGVDAPARYGGEEFVVALPETDIEGAVEVGERIRTQLAAQTIPLVEGEGEISVTASLGAATMPAAGREVSELIAAADAALYEAKRSGKNRVQVAEGNGTEWRTDAE